MDDKFILGSGKYAGKTLGWLKINQPSYLNWVRENQPNMLKSFKKIEPKQIIENNIVINGRIQPNLNFDKEGPDPITIGN